MRLFSRRTISTTAWAQVSVPSFPTRLVLPGNQKDSHIKSRSWNAAYEGDEVLDTVLDGRLGNRRPAHASAKGTTCTRAGSNRRYQRLHNWEFSSPLPEPRREQAEIHRWFLTKTIAVWTYQSVFIKRNLFFQDLVRNEEGSFEHSYVCSVHTIKMFSWVAHIGA